MQWVETSDPRYKQIPGYDEQIDFIPANKIYIDIDPTQVMANKYLEPKFADKIVPQLHIDFGSKSYLGKQELAILKMLQGNKWKRPIYYAVTVEESQFLGLKNAFLQEGLAYKITPMKSVNGQPMVNTNKMYDLMMNKFRWGNIQDPKVYLDDNNLRMCRTHRMIFSLLANALYEEGQLKKAENVIDYCMKVIPMNTVAPNYYNVAMAELYYKLGKPKKAYPILKRCADVSLEYLNWTYSLKPVEYNSAKALVNAYLYTMQEILAILSQYDKAKVQLYMQAFQKHGQLYQQYQSYRNAQ